MKLKPTTTFLIALVFVAAGIAATIATGLWQTESDKTPRKLDLAAVETAVTAGGGTADGDAAAVQYDPADIRGSYSFGEISTLYGVPLSDLARAFGLSEAEAGDFQAKALESRYPDAAEELGTASIRMFVAYYLGLPYTPTEETWLPRTAVEVLTASGRMTAQQAAYASAHAIP